MEIRDTIVAPATPPGEGGVGIIRLSGNRAEELLMRFFRPTSPNATLESHHLYHGTLIDGEGGVVDEVMAVVMHSPRSYTRENVAEIHCHGGTVVLRQVLDLFIESGARLARPGEFTLRAFLNGRIDLAQAEGVIDLIRSRSEASSKVALGQMGGRLSTAIFGFRSDLADLLAEIEAHIDFPEEDIEPEGESLLLGKARMAAGRMDHLLATFDAGRVLREGVSVLILGRPNVGKSSLLNALLGESRAIVTEIPGTTRDTIEENLSLGGVPLRLIDTAGVRNTLDPVEAEGVRRARQRTSSVDLVLLVVDGSVPLTEEDLLALDACEEARTLLVVNKGDLETLPLPSPFTQLPSMVISAHTGGGLDQLRERIVSFFAGDQGGDVGETAVLSDRRHKEALVRARQALGRFCEGLESRVSPEFLALDLREGLQGLGEITGETAPDEILERIFTKFCIGK